MKKRKVNVGLIVAVILASALLLYWLFAATLINEDENIEMSPVTIEHPS